ncbi:MAG: hypothetical protein HC820_06115 [Hydrococcus sp. RM1_1_31]|nr:hypothetical protein [Hydrococcus sp. RM1_1_31]
MSEPSVRKLTEPTARYLFDRASESVGLGSNLVSVLDRKNGERVDWRKAREVGEITNKPGRLAVGERVFF